MNFKKFLVCRFLPKSAVCLVLCFFAYTNANSQQIENVDFSLEGNTLVVTYDLINCPTKSFYNIGLTFIDRSNKNIIPISIGGDIKKVYPGTGKKIVWKYTDDSYIGDIETDLKATVKILESFSTQIKGGPQNAILSMILPGWGDHYVNKVKKSTPYLVSLLYLGAAGYGLYQKMESDKYYKLYLNATDQNEMDTQYNLASEANKNFVTYAGAAALIWVIDVISVLNKGSKNAREIKKRNGLASSFSNIKPVFTLARNNQPAQFGIIKRF